MLGLTAGLFAACVLPALSAPVGCRRFVAVAAAAVAVLALAGGASAALDDVGRTRVTVSSPDRQQETRAALRLVAGSPLVGVGPGQAELRWDGPEGRVLVAKYAHNEYVQVLVELGVVGLALVVALLVLSAREIRTARAVAPASPLRRGAVAGLVALLVASAFDFLWHLPAIPLVAAVLVAFTVPKQQREREKQ